VPREAQRRPDDAGYGVSVAWVRTFYTPDDKLIESISFGRNQSVTSIHNAADRASHIDSAVPEAGGLVDVDRLDPTTALIQER
jgi:hypothetical protein